MKILNHEFFSTSTSNLRQNRGSQSGHTTRNLHISMSSSFKTYHRIVDKSNTTAVTSGAGIANHFGASEFTPPPPSFANPDCVRFVLLNMSVFCLVFHRSLLVFCAFSFGIFFNLRYLFGIFKLFFIERVIIAVYLYIVHFLTYSSRRQSVKICSNNNRLWSDLAYHMVSVRF